jgi:hypothetical protein
MAIVITYPGRNESFLIAQLLHIGQSCHMHPPFAFIQRIPNARLGRRCRVDIVPIKFIARGFPTRILRIGSFTV